MISLQWEIALRHPPGASVLHYANLVLDGPNEVRRYRRTMHLSFDKIAIRLFLLEHLFAVLILTDRVQEFLLV
jgi:hypothetical protein